MTEIIIVISIFVLIACASRYCLLHTIYKKLTSIEIDLMCIETRQKYILNKIDYENKEK